MANAIVLVADSSSAQSIKHNQRLVLEQNHLTVNSTFNKYLGKKERKERNQYLEVIKHLTPTPSV